MDSGYSDFFKELLEKPEFHCPVCGSERYITDQGNHEVTIHCSSSAARFWEFDRGSLGQTVAKQHWDQSKLELFQALEDAVRGLRPEDPVPTKSQSDSQS